MADDVDFGLSSPEADQDLFEMANLYPRDTGLPMTIWVSPRGHARHDVRVKVSMTPGDRMDADNTATVAVRPHPRVLHGELSPNEAASVSAWVGLNEGALVDYWNGVISTVEFVNRLSKLS
jgi:hypothetical protein